MESLKNGTATTLFDLGGMTPLLHNGGLLAMSTLAVNLACLAEAAAFTNSSFSNRDTSLTFLYQNNLNASDDINHAGAILLDPTTQNNGAAQCATLGEDLISVSTLERHADDFEKALRYLAYAELVEPVQRYYVQDAVLTVDSAQGGSLAFSSKGTNTNGSQELPVLCTQSSTENSAENAQAAPSNEVVIPSAGNAYVGFRNQKSFRFLGIPYANAFERFEYSTVNNATGRTINATGYGPGCSQAGDDTSSEDCLFLNVQTPYIPRAGSAETERLHLRPVMFSIHGGGFTGGNGGADSGLDGGNMASREDIVSVELNYRLSTIGFLAVPGTRVRGNYGIGDQITALEVRRHVLEFSHRTKETV